MLTAVQLWFFFLRKERCHKITLGPSKWALTQASLSHREVRWLSYLLLGSCNPQGLLWKGPYWFKVCRSQTRETQRTATPVESPSLSHLNVNPLDLIPPSIVSHCPGFLIQIHLRSEMFVLLGFTFVPQGGHVMIRSKLLVCTCNQKSFRRFYYCYLICSGTLLHLLVIFYFCYINQ